MSAAVQKRAKAKRARNRNKAMAGQNVVWIRVAIDMTAFQEAAYELSRSMNDFAMKVGSLR